ncbi:hypothetical protein [Curvibacter fontanus]
MTAPIFEAKWSDDVSQNNKLSTRSMFRQNAQIQDAEGVRKIRHWLMDSAAGRELLKTAAARCSPGSRLPVFSNPPSIDEEIEPYIDKLGLRQLEEPTNPMQKELTEIYLIWRSLKAALFGR